MLFEAKTENLDEVLARVEAILEESDLPAKFVISFLVAVEEIFVNIASYAYCDGTGNVEIEVETYADSVKVRFKDSGVEFDPLSREDPDTGVSAEDRPIGGLGIFMVKKSMDGINYKREDGMNVLEFWKNF